MTLHDLKIACPAYNMVAHDGVCERCRGGRLHNVVVHRCIKGSISLSTIVMVEAVLHRVLGSYRKCVSRFVVPSRFYIDKFSEWGMPRSQFRHVPNFVDADRYLPRYTPGDAFRLFWPGVAREGIGHPGTRCQGRALSIVGRWHGARTRRAARANGETQGGCHISRLSDGRGSASGCSAARALWCCRPSAMRMHL